MLHFCPSDSDQLPEDFDFDLEELVDTLEARANFHQIVTEDVSPVRQIITLS